MARIALYRKYRPQNFDELYGQEHISTTLKNSIESGNFSHAYLFCGPRGTGKTSVARILAKAINCQSPEKGNPDNKCESCKTISTDKTMDIIEIDAASHTQVDNIREIIVERANFAPTNLKYKVYIIDEAHMLSKSSFNALLKTLEEPPAHAIFILATTEANKILPTIVSRCQRYDFRRINAKDMLARLEFISKSEKIKIDKAALELIVEISEGGFRDAISLLDQLSSLTEGEITREKAEKVLGLSGIKAIEDLVLAMTVKNVEKCFGLISGQIEEGRDLAAFYKALVEYFRKLLIASLSGVENIKSSEESSEIITKILKNFSTEKIIDVIDILTENEKLYKNSPIPQLGLEIVAVKVCKDIKKEPVSTGTLPEKTVASSTKKAEVKKVPINADDKVKWQQALLEIKNRNNSIHAFLKVCEPEFEDDQIKLHFPYKFHKERIEDHKNRVIVEESLKKVLGVNYKIKCLLRSNLGAAAVVQQEKKDDLLEEALEIFGGEVMA